MKWLAGVAFFALAPVGQGADEGANTQAKAVSSVTELRPVVEELEQRYSARCAYIQSRKQGSGSQWIMYFIGPSGFYSFWANVLDNGDTQVMPLRQQAAGAVAAERRLGLDRFPLPWDEVERREKEDPCSVLEIHMYPQVGVWKISRLGHAPVSLVRDITGSIWATPQR